MCVAYVERVWIVAADHVCRHIAAITDSTANGVLSLPSSHMLRLMTSTPPLPINDSIDFIMSAYVDADAAATVVSLPAS
jgi:hypothetical protein